MSPRRKTIPDAHVVEAAAEVVARRGALHTRLSDVAVAAGLAPATLVQRFGSLDALLGAIGEVFVARVRAAFRSQVESPLTGLIPALESLRAAGQLGFLLVHPKSGAAYSLELRKQIAYVLAAAIEAGELPHCDVARQARRLQLAYYGVATAALLEADGAQVERDMGQLASEILGDFL